MSFLGLFPNERERRLANEEAAHAIHAHGDQADMILLMKAQQTRSPERRMVYKLARKIVQGHD
jgi:chromosome condensin MukBEF ATPase and DNA-binding subunit MukB